MKQNIQATICKPCQEPCHKCGSNNTSLQYYEPNDIITKPTRFNKSTQFVDRSIPDDYYIVLKECTIHTCNTCKYEWDGNVQFPSNEIYPEIFHNQTKTVINEQKERLLELSSIIDHSEIIFDKIITDIHQCPLLKKEVGPLMTKIQRIKQQGN